MEPAACRTDPHPPYDPAMSPRRLASFGIVSAFWLFVLAVGLNTVAADTNSSVLRFATNMLLVGSGLALPLGLLLAIGATLGRRDRGRRTTTPAGRHL